MTIFRHPVFTGFLMAGVSAIGVEGICYFDRDRHATPSELGVVALLIGILHGGTQFFLSNGRRENLRVMLQVTGIGRVIFVFEKLEDTAWSWQALVARSIVMLICGGLIGASIDALVEYRRRAKSEA